MTVYEHLRLTTDTKKRLQNRPEEAVPLGLRSFQLSSIMDAPECRPLGALFLYFTSSTGNLGIYGTERLRR
jgi:hypothetical protein